MPLQPDPLGKLYCPRCGLLGVAVEPTAYGPAVRCGGNHLHLRDVMLTELPTASVDRSPEGQDPRGLGAEHEHAVPSEETADAQPIGEQPQ